MVTINLQRDDWFSILNALAELPFKQVAPLIQNIQQQMLPQLNVQQPTPVPNGSMADTGQEIN